MAPWNYYGKDKPRGSRHKQYTALWFWTDEGRRTHITFSFDHNRHLRCVELDYFNALQMLRLAKVEPIAEKRGEREPIIIAGGPCATFNPEPLALFFDAFVIGEGEEILPVFMDVYQEKMIPIVSFSGD